MRYVLAALLSLACAAASAAPLAFEQVAIVDVERGALVRDRFVVVDDGRIRAIGDASIVPEGATRILANAKIACLRADRQRVKRQGEALAGRSIQVDLRSIHVLSDVVAAGVPAGQGIAGDLLAESRRACP